MGGGGEVLGDDTVHGWFSSSFITSGPPDFTGTLPTRDVADLFARFHAADLAPLPHRNGNAGCGLSGAVRDCSDCKETTLSHSVDKSVVLEMNAAWARFDER